MKLDTINAIIIFVMLMCAVGFGFYYNYSLVNECTSNPLIFGAKQLERQNPTLEFFGNGYFKDEKGNIAVITFNSTELRLKT